jgi:opacity protein-like surface antigen
MFNKFNKLLVATIVMIVSPSIAFASASVSSAVTGNAVSSTNAASNTENVSTVSNNVNGDKTAAGAKPVRDLKGEKPACPVYQYATGPYVGLSFSPRVNYTGTPTNYIGIEGTVSLGYGALLKQKWYVAAEIFGGDSLQIKDDKASGFRPHGGVKTAGSYGISVIPGFMISDHVLTYFRLGLLNTGFSDQGTDKTGGQFGIGGQTSIAKKWDLRAEYVYISYRHVPGIGKANSDQFNVGIVYKFI